MKPPIKTDHRFVKATTLAEYLDVHRATVYKLAKSGVIPFVCVGNAMRFNLTDVLEALESNLSELPDVPAAQ